MVGLGVLVVCCCFGLFVIDCFCLTCLLFCLFGCVAWVFVCWLFVVFILFSFVVRLLRCVAVCLGWLVV